MISHFIQYQKEIITKVNEQIELLIHQKSSQICTNIDKLAPDSKLALVEEGQGELARSGAERTSSYVMPPSTNSTQRLPDKTQLPKLALAEEDQGELAHSGAERTSSYVMPSSTNSTQRLPDKVEFDLTEAILYSSLAGGKRTRAQLTVLCADLFDIDFDISIKIAAIIEMIHTYSLIHDDLPAMDNDDYRRGKLTCHKKYNEAIAILAGDGLLTHAFEILSSDIIILDPTIKCKLIHLIASHSGINGMIKGQVIDMFGNQTTEEELKLMQYLKTGKLISAACTAGAVIANANEETYNSLSEYAKNLGLAFQIRDDILDSISTKEVLGKSIGKDRSQDKKNFVTLLGIDEAKSIAQHHTDLALEFLDIFGNKADNLRNLTIELLDREK